MSYTSMHAKPSSSLFNASAKAALSTIGHLAQLMNTALFFIIAIFSREINPFVFALLGRLRGKFFPPA